MAHNIGTLQRRLTTLIEEFKRTRDTWEEINGHAFPLANTLTNSVLQSRYFIITFKGQVDRIHSQDHATNRYVDEPQYWHPALTMMFPDLIQKYDLKMQRIIEKQNHDLIDLVEKMVTLLISYSQ